MSKRTMPTLAEMRGDKPRAPKLKLNEIRFNGDEKQFIYINVLGGPKDIDGKKQFEKRLIGETINVTFLKIRRRLYAYQAEKRPYASNEHNTKFDTITLYADTKVVGTNDELREKYPDLKTHQIVYALYNGELVRLLVKGAALGSRAKQEGVHTFYSYISSFNRERGAEEHMDEYVTQLYPVQESGAGKKYTTFSFKRDRKLTEEEMKDVEEKMAQIYFFCKDYDAYYTGKDATTEIPQDEIDTIEYDDGNDDDGINPDEVPF